MFLFLLWCRHEFWWRCEMLAGMIWRRYCPDGKATYWLDWLPAFCFERRATAQRSLNVRGYNTELRRINNG